MGFKRVKKRKPAQRKARETHWIGRNSAGPVEAFRGLKEGSSIYGLSDGTWSLIDGIEALLDLCGPSDVTIATWTAAHADLERAERLLGDGRIKTLRLLVDRSFEGRQPAYCIRARSLFGDQAIRVWNSHAKFCLLLGGELDVLYLTSANLNANKRLENYSVIAGGALPAEYLAAVEELWKIQKPGEAFDGGSFLGRRHTAAVLGVERLLTRKELAEAIGRSATGINKLVASGMPVAKQGHRGRGHGYRLEDVERWLEAREASATTEHLDAVRERALKERAQRHLAEQMLAVRAGELVPKDEVLREWQARLVAAKTLMLAWPTAISAQLQRASRRGGADGIRAQLEVSVHDALEEMAGVEPEPEPEDKPKPAPRKAKRKTKAKVAKHKAVRKKVARKAPARRAKK